MRDSLYRFSTKKSAVNSSPFGLAGTQGLLGDAPEQFKSRYAYQKNPRVRKIFVRNSGAGNGRANFMDAWKNAFFLQENPCP